VNEVVRWLVLGHFGSGYLALGLNHKMICSDSSFYWELG